MNLVYLFYVVCAVWAASELWLGWSHRSADRSRQRDAGTLRLLILIIYASIGIGVWVALQRLSPLPEPPRLALFLVGLAMMAAGLLFRWWSIRVLAQYFTVDVSIREDHRIVRDGPYRWLRHPSYTGALATFYGFGLCLGDTVAMLVIVVPVTLAFLHRMRIEEAVLAEAFPVDYPAYAGETKRLLPGIW
jgi:protein-S-isoprenylcysteine O-methyltransferase